MRLTGKKHIKESAKKFSCTRNPEMGHLALFKNTSSLFNECILYLHNCMYLPQYLHTDAMQISYGTIQEVGQVYTCCS